MKPGLIEHIEKYLGKIQAGFTLDSSSGFGTDSLFQVIKSTNGVVPGVSCYSTLGLSNFGLNISKVGQPIFHELFLAVNDISNSRNIPSLLQSLSLECIESENAYFRGQVIGPREGVVIKDTKFNALYVAMPAYWPDSFSTCELADRTIVFAWLVPITDSEVNYINANGWNSFEDQLIDSNVDMCDLNRKAVR